MTDRFFITGTDTDVGKTVAAAWLALHMGAAYWKPVQSGPEKDADVIRDLTDATIYPTTYDLSEPLSPHEAAKRDGVEIDMNRFELPDTDGPLVVEGAGGLLVPLTRTHLVIDLIAQLSLPSILVARSGLGTINHTLLSLEALRARNLPVAGLILSGPKTPHNRKALEDYGKVPVLAEIDHLDPLTKDALLSIEPETVLKAAA